MATATRVHCFEAAGLGKAPFRYLGIERQELNGSGQRIIGNIGGCELSTKPGGSCAYCGTYIVRMFNVESSDGQKFHVGCDCILKTGDSGLIKQVESDVKQIEREQRQARKQRKEQADRELCARVGEVSGKLASKPHPIKYHADLGRTLLDYVQWCIDNKVRATAAKYIKAEIA